ncbi:MAG: hypothetical protein HY326_10270 [Chloroflexi bacterium]|nr:hypothetical protein [Chloroflexota bacterium]
MRSRKIYGLIGLLLLMVLAACAPSLTRAPAAEAPPSPAQPAGNLATDGSTLTHATENSHPPPRLVIFHSPL